MKIYFHINLEGYSNCYIITNPEIKEAIIVDPGKITKKLIEHIENDNYNLVAILITHNHGSHTNGLETLRKIYTPKIYSADSQAAGAETIVLKGDGVFKIAGMTVGYFHIGIFLLTLFAQISKRNNNFFFNKEAEILSTK